MEHTMLHSPRTLMISILFGWYVLLFNLIYDVTYTCSLNPDPVLTTDQSPLSILPSITGPKCSLDPLAWGPLGPRASGSKLYKNFIKTEGLFGQSGRTAWSMRTFLSIINPLISCHLPGWPNKPAVFMKLYNWLPFSTLFILGLPNISGWLQLWFSGCNHHQLLHLHHSDNWWLSSYRFVTRYRFTKILDTMLYNSWFNHIFLLYGIFQI